MIFGPELVTAILEGRKTVTRRRLTHRDGRDIRYRVGHTYAIQPGRGKPHVGHINVLAMSTQQLGEISLFDAYAEGFCSVDAFLRYWRKLHGDCDAYEPVAVVQFELAAPCPKCARWEP